MKSRSFITSKSNGFEGQFKNLNNNEMINLRGGGQSVPPLPPPSGEDYPIDLNKVSSKSLTSYVLKVPVLLVQTTVVL